jgi:hypothetical protein
MNEHSLEVVLLPPDGLEGGGSDVWLRKRLVEALDTVTISLEERLDEIRRYLDDSASRHSLLDPIWRWKFVVVSIPWHSQVGPSCGLAVVRMVRDHFAFRNPADDDAHAVSMLQYAQELGMSVDGELFDAEDLASITESYCGPDAAVQVQEFPSVPEILSSLCDDRGFVIITYDSQPRTRLPCHNSGLSAHWGIVVGALIGCPSQEPPSDRIEVLPWMGESSDSVGEEAVLLLVQHGFHASSRLRAGKSFVPPMPS